MFAIAFDMDVNALKTNYGEPYNNAYYEIKTALRVIKNLYEIYGLLG